MKPGLLDVNVLIALIDPNHEFHAPAHQWFEKNSSHRWATCPITQNGCVRIMSSPGYPFPGLTPGRVQEILAEFVQLPEHLFWPDSLSLLERGRFFLGETSARRLTDLYLLGLASSNGGRLITFDRNVGYAQVAGCGPDSIEVIPPDGRTC
jgi:toxin-antitoxin system PIN domain toxin